MSSTYNKAVKDFAKTLQDLNTNKPSAYDTPAEVLRVEGNTAWVHIPGGVDETPVQLTTNAKKGDIVQVRIAGGSAWLYGNVTAPPTDDTKAISAENKAILADEHAVDAIFSANIAKDAADSAQASAIAAATAASTADEHATAAIRSAADASSAATIAGEKADAASRDANIASRAATNALTGLATLESVIDTVNWFSKHKTLSTDTEVNPNKTYYIYNEITGVLTEAQPEGTENPSEEGWYELNEAIANYVASHVAQTDDGLSIVNSLNGWRVLVSSGSTNYSPGVYIMNPLGEPVSQYGEGMRMGPLNGQHISIESGQINFWDGPEQDSSNLVAYVTGQALHIPKVVVVKSLQMGNWIWDAIIDNHLSLNWIGGN